jgi:hypothetical protein
MTATFSSDWLTAELLLALASTVILGLEAHGIHDYILLSDGSGSRPPVLANYLLTD